MQVGRFQEMAENLGLAPMRKPALVGVAIVLVLVAVLAAGRLIGTATASDFTISAQNPDAPVEATASDLSPAVLFVHVSGEVNSPGLCQVQHDARVADAVQAAGGFTERADADTVNLARPVQDGEHIHINAKVEGESVVSTVTEEGGEITGESIQGASKLVNINQASKQELIALPGIGESTAQKIVADRQSNGPFESVEDLKRISGIGDRKLEALRDLICV